MAIQLGRYGSRNNLNLQIFDFVTSTPLMTFDYATTTSNEWTSETVFARGGDGNPKRIAWSGEKDSTLKVETQIFTLQHLAMLAGEPIEKGAQDLYKSQILTVMKGASGTKQITLDKAPIGDKTNVKVFAYINGIMADAQPVKDIVDNVVTLDTTATIEIGSDVEVYYQYNTPNAAKLSYTTKGFPGYVFLAGDTLYADEKAGKMVGSQQIFRKAKLQPNYTVNYSPSGDPSSLSLTFDLFPVTVNGVEVMKEEIIYEK
ncbi:hypothetical protein L8C07_05230 [Paenibacillus sp. CMAA1739]|uniref:hypothetical protein n=1 Tax=Paenibacillus ottowii TaxID=2315729 RepID=UPI002DBB777D|nr:hypothetical protein [Paenibacillus sp. CMAA1739]MEC4565339.1 hypothetical protein [Paenibacillus sp. CMAA1739]